MPNEENEEVQITISGVPKKLLRKLDALAGQEHRPRSKQVVKILTEAVQRRAPSEGQPQAA
jgi:metal-responsive CopG/Arc/MetJ family transcriptional regulator